MSTINWSELQQQADEASRPLPDGMYPVEVEKATSADSSKGNPMIKLELRVWDGPGTGRKLFTQLTLSLDNPMALSFFFRNLGAFGIDANVLSSQPAMETLASMLVGRKATADVNTRPYQGVDRNNVKNFAAAAPGVIQGAVVAPLGVGSSTASALGGMTSGTIGSTNLGGALAGSVPMGSPVSTPAVAEPVVVTAAATPAEVPLTEEEKKTVPSF